jgi:hypothetical protein
MTREIDFSEPLDEADEAYVRDRPWLIQDAELRGETVRFESEEEFTLDSDDETNDETDDQTGDNTEGSEDDEDGDESATGDDTEASDAEDDADEAEDEADGEEVPPYSEWDFADLKTEAGNRGLKQNGSKESLIARLEEHDASQPE